LREATAGYLKYFDFLTNRELKGKGFEDICNLFFSREEEEILDWSRGS